MVNVRTPRSMPREKVSTRSTGIRVLWDICGIFWFINKNPFTGGTDMPKVGGKHFSYSKKGKTAAKRYAKKTGKKMTNTRKKRKY